jgi:hypothetical protein
MKPGDFEDIPDSSILHYVQGVGVLRMNVMAAQSMQYC